MKEPFMTPEQRRIVELERKLRFMRADTAVAVVLGVGVFPWLLEELHLPLFNDLAARLQLGILLALIFVLAVSGFRNFRYARRDAALRTPDFPESTPDLNRDR